MEIGDWHVYPQWEKLNVRSIVDFYVYNVTCWFSSLSNEIVRFPCTHVGTFKPVGILRLSRFLSLMYRYYWLKIEDFLSRITLFMSRDTCVTLIANR